VKLIVKHIQILVLGRESSIIIFDDSLIYFSEKLIRTQAQLLAQGGYLDAGYEYIIIDDCWLNHTRAEVKFRIE
jgi:threonine aldolase